MLILQSLMNFLMTIFNILILNGVCSILVSAMSIEKWSYRLYIDQGVLCVCMHKTRNYYIKKTKSFIFGQPLLVT